MMTPIRPVQMTLASKVTNSCLPTKMLIRRIAKKSAKTGFLMTKQMHLAEKLSDDDDDHDNQDDHKDDVDHDDSR